MRQTGLPCPAPPASHSDRGVETGSCMDGCTTNFLRFPAVRTVSTRSHSSPRARRRRSVIRFQQLFRGRGRSVPGNVW